MSRSPRIRPTGAAAVIGVLIGALALTGCGAGQVTQTAQQVAAVGGANAGAAGVVVRNAEIEFAEGAEGAVVYPRGGSAPLRMSIVNTEDTADRLVSASSPAASSVQLSGDLEIPGGRLVAVEGGAPAAVAAPTATPTASAAPGAPQATPTPAPSTADGVAPEGTQIVLTGLREDLQTGLTYPLVLTFERAGEIRLDVPVANPAEPREDEPAE